MSAMSRIQHYHEAERLLTHTELSVGDRFGDGAECARQQLAAGLIHAVLATVPDEVQVVLDRERRPRDRARP